MVIKVALSNMNLEFLLQERPFQSSFKTPKIKQIYIGFHNILGGIPSILLGLLSSLAEILHPKLDDLVRFVACQNVGCSDTLRIFGFGISA